jgi:hypothetical protein
MKMSGSVMTGTTSCQKCPALSFIKSKLKELAGLVDDFFQRMASGIINRTDFVQQQMPQLVHHCEGLTGYRILAFDVGASTPLR